LLVEYFLSIGKGHSQAALSLWNNMLEPVGGKQWSWHFNETLKCPTDDYPYIFTKQNSAQALKEYQRRTLAPIQSNSEPIESNSPKASTKKSHRDESHHDKQHVHHQQHKKHRSETFFTKLNLIATLTIGCLVILILIVVVTKRDNIRTILHGARRRHMEGFDNPVGYDDQDDVEIWNRSSNKSAHSLNKSLPNTHGTRVTFD
jgi:hypothetical protein